MAVKTEIDSVAYTQYIYYIYSERLVCRQLPPSSEEPPVPFQLLYQLDLLSSVTLTLSSAFRLVVSVSVDHRHCKVPLQRISLSVTLISTFIIIIIIIIILFMKQVGCRSCRPTNSVGALKGNGVNKVQ